jgi:formate dehydrogenase subunit delta
MVNDIVVNLGYLPAEKVPAAVAEHVTKFWDPRMKHRLAELVAAETEGVNPVVAAAAALLR